MAKSKIKPKSSQEVLGVSKKRKGRKSKNKSVQQPTKQRVKVVGADGKKRWEWR